jgi:hypothetical protein
VVRIAVVARFLRDLGVDGRDIPAEDERAARYRIALARRRMPELLAELLAKLLVKKAEVRKRARRPSRCPL